MAASLLRRAALAGLLFAAAAAEGAAVPAPGEYEVKAAFLYNFAKFVEWPPPAFPAPDASFNICFLGASPLDGQIESMLADKTIQDRKPAVRKIPRPESAGGCQVLFIAPSENGRLEEVLAALKDAPVLTVGDGEPFARRGGMIGFTLEEKKVRFIINPGPAAASGLKISSQLLKLAKVVQ